MSERVNNIKTTLILMIIEANTLPKSKLANVLDSDVAVEKNKTGKFAFLASVYFQEVSGHAVTDEGYYTISYVQEVYDWLYKEALELKAKKQLENPEKTLEKPENTRLLNEYNALKNAITEKMKFIVATRKNPPKDILNLSSKKATNGQRVLVQDYDLYEELITTSLALEEAKNNNDIETFLANLSKELVGNLSLNQDILDLIIKYNPSLRVEEEKPLIRSRQIDFTSEAEIHASASSEVKPIIIFEEDELEVREEVKGNVASRENVTSLKVDVETVKVANAFRRVIECLKTPRVKRLESPTLTSRVEKLVQDYIKAQENYLNPEFVKEIKELLVVDPNLAVKPVEIDTKEVVDQEILKVADAFLQVANCLDATQVKRLDAPNFKEEITELAQEYLDEKRELISPDLLKELDADTLTSRQETLALAAKLKQVGEFSNQSRVKELTLISETSKQEILETANKLRQIGEFLNSPRVKELTSMTLTHKQELLETAEKLRQVGEFLNRQGVKELEASTLTSRQETRKLADKLRQIGEFLNSPRVKELTSMTSTHKQELLEIAKQLRQVGETLNRQGVKELEAFTLISRQETKKLADKLRQISEVLNHLGDKELTSMTLTHKQELLETAEKLKQVGDFLNRQGVKELEASTLTSRQETKRLAKQLRQIGEFLNSPRVKELTSMTLTHKQELLEAAEKLRRVASKLGQTDYKMLEAGKIVAEAKEKVKPNLGKMINYSNLVRSFQLDDRAEKVSKERPESHIPQGLKSSAQAASQFKKHEAKIQQANFRVNEKLNAGDDLAEYLAENRELIRRYLLQKQQFDNKIAIDENAKNASDILDCLIDILKIRIDDDEQLLKLDRGQMIRISDITIYYRLQGFLEQIQNKDKTTELEEPDNNIGKRLAKPKHLKASLKRKKTLKYKFNLDNKLITLFKNYWKPVLCGVGAGLTLFLATLGIQNSKNKQEEVSVISYEQNYDLNNRPPYDVLFKYPFGTMNNIMSDYATKDYYLINLNGTVYLTTRKYDANTGYISYYDARDNMELIGKYFIGSIVNPGVQEELGLNYGYGAKIIQEAVVPLDKIIPYKYFSQYDFDWLISNNTLVRKMLPYNTNNKDNAEIKKRKMQKFELIYNDVVEQEITGYRVSLDENSLDYYCFYDVKTGRFYRVDGNAWNLLIRVQDMAGTSYTVNEVSSKMKADNILILNSTVNPDILNIEGTLEDYYCLVFYKANSNGSLIFKDVFNKDAEILVEKDFAGLSYVDKSKGVKIYTTADLVNNNILVNINEFFAVYGYSCFQVEYTVEDVINSINSFKSYTEMQKGGSRALENIEGAILASDIMIFDTTSDSVDLVKNLSDHSNLDEIASGDYYKSNISLDYASGRHKKYYFLRNTGMVDEYNSAEYVDIFDEYSMAVIGEGLSWAHYYTGTDAIGWSNLDKEHKVDMGVKNINVFLQLNGLGDLVKDYYTMEDLSVINDYLNNRNLTRNLS